MVCEDEQQKACQATDVSQFDYKWVIISIKYHSLPTLLPSSSIRWFAIFSHWGDMLDPITYVSLKWIPPLLGMLNRPPWIRNCLLSASGPRTIIDTILLPVGELPEQGDLGLPQRDEKEMMELLVRDRRTWPDWLQQVGHLSVGPTKTPKKEGKVRSSMFARNKLHLVCETEAQDIRVSCDPDLGHPP